MNTKTLTRGAIMVALAVVLSMVTVYKLPNGGSITAASMVPIIFIALTCNFKMGILTALVYAAIQMAMGFYPPPTQDFISFMLVILFDYVIAYGILGFAGVFYKAMGKTKIAAMVATAAVLFGRFVCHFISGITIWKVYAPEGTPVWMYAAGYNGSYMAVECIISVIVVSLLYNRLIKKAN